MKNKIKSILFLAFTILLFINISCLTTEEKVERTPEMELAELNDFIDALTGEGYDIDTTELGVYYIVDTMGTGPSPNAGDTLFVEYTGAFLNGTIFDASIDHWPAGIWEFVYLEQNLIHGFNSTLSIMNEGAKVDAVFPSSLGYGITGYGSIPPYASLIFSITLHDIKPKLN